MTDDDHEEEDGRVVRPFLLTKGRTRSGGPPVVMESLVERKDVDSAAYASLDRTRQAIFDLLTERLSAAELSAKLSLPLGVIFVLVGDMASDDILVVHKTADLNDIALIRRLIDGVRAY